MPAPRLFFWQATWHQPPLSRFVAVAHADQQPWLASPDVPCAVEPLCACVERSAEWKGAHGFPLEVREVLTSASWKHVVLAAPQRLFAAVIRTAGTLVALAVQTRTWELQTNQPAWIVPDEDWMQAAPDSAWRQTFVEWCRQRQIGSRRPRLSLTWRASFAGAGAGCGGRAFAGQARRVRAATARSARRHAQNPRRVEQRGC